MHVVCTWTDEVSTRQLIGQLQANRRNAPSLSRLVSPSSLFLLENTSVTHPQAWKE
jgi:hypothetical protein